MNYSTIVKRIAEQLCVSPTTVMRALSRTGFVKKATQDAIIRLAIEQFPEYKSLIHSKKKCKNVTVIMPQKPSFFWDRALSGARDALKEYESEALCLHSLFYSYEKTEEEFLAMIEHLRGTELDALAVVVPHTAQVKKVLNNLSQEIPVALFNEYGDYENCFVTVYGDGYEEGAASASLLSRCSLKSKRILVIRDITTGSRLQQDRLDGFLEAIKDKKGCHVVDCLDIEGAVDNVCNYHTTRAAIYAREISSYLERHSRSFNCIQIMDGMLYPLQNALVKLKMSGDAYCFGYDASESAKRCYDKGLKGGYVNSDIYGQAKMAVKALAEKLVYDRTLFELGWHITGYETCLFD